MNGMRPDYIIIDEIDLVEISLVDNPVFPECKVIEVRRIDENQ